MTRRRIGRLGLAPDVRCLEVGGGRGSIARWLCQDVAPRGQVTATDLDTGFLSELSLPNLTVLRHDVRTEAFSERCVAIRVNRALSSPTLRSVWFVVSAGAPRGAALAGARSTRRQVCKRRDAPCKSSQIRGVDGNQVGM